MKDFNTDLMRFLENWYLDSASIAADKQVEKEMKVNLNELYERIVACAAEGKEKECRDAITDLDSYHGAVLLESMRQSFLNGFVAATRLQGLMSLAGCERLQKAIIKGTDV